jgi:hypothetical protein
MITSPISLTTTKLLFPLTPRIFFPQFFPPESCTHFLSLAFCHMTRLSYPLWFDVPKNIWWEVKIVDILIMQFLYQHFPSACVGPKTSLSNQISITFRLCSFLNVWDQFSTPYKTTTKIIIFFQCHQMSLMDFLFSPPGFGRSVTDF